SQISIGISRESSEHEMQIIQSMISNGCRGLIIDPCVSEIDGAMARLLLAKKYPFVFLDRYFPDIPTSYVTCDNRGGAGQAARALLDRYRNEVAIFYFPLFNSAVCERYDGFCAEFVDAGFAMEAKNRCLIDDSGLFYSNNSVRFNLIFETILAHLKKHPSLRGFFAVNAEIAQVLNIVLSLRPVAQNRERGVRGRQLRQSLSAGLRLRRAGHGPDDRGDHPAAVCADRRRLFPAEHHGAHEIRAKSHWRALFLSRPAERNGNQSIIMTTG
ncbi:MAG: substrate-binding domain-containing protein, partial [Alistipes sp.]